MAISFNRAVFFDKDGTLVKDVPYNIDPTIVSFTEGTETALSILKGMFQFHIITNQAGVALGLFSEDELIPMEKKLSEMFNQQGAHLAGFHYCPHASWDNCQCRKPGTLMLTKASCEYGIDLQKSWLIGDILDDIEAGNRAGCKTILLDNGNETEWILNALRIPDFKVATLEQAAKVILQEEEQNEFMERS